MGCTKKENSDPTAVRLPQARLSTLPAPYSSCAAVCLDQGWLPLAQLGVQAASAQLYLQEARQTYPEYNIERSRSVCRLRTSISVFPHLHAKWRSSAKDFVLV